MSDEIKEILDNLEIVARKHTIELCEDGSKIETMSASIIDELRLNNFSAKVLLDYITNLQQENERLIKELENVSLDEANIRTDIRKDSIKHNYKLYEEIKWKGLDWIIIALDNDNIRLLLKDVIPRNILEKIIGDKWYLADDNDVIMSDNIRPPFDFKESYISTDILPNFCEHFNIICDDIDLLTEEEVENLPEEVKKCNDWYWAKTTCESDRKYACVWCVTASGFLTDFHTVSSSFGVRPLVSLPIKILKENSNKN